jgi:hypothetical protein
MPFEQGFGLHKGDHFTQQLAEGFAFFGEHFALRILKPPVR